MSRKEWSLGIDFGTSNTAAAHTNPVKDTVEPINLSHDRTTMSSSVYMENSEDVEVGEVALNKAEANPAGFIPSPKRLIPQQVFQVNGYDVPSSLPVSAVLKSVITRASRKHEGTAPTELVLTHPEAWSEREIQVLIDAVSTLGLSADKIKTVSEPQAAAQYYTRAKELKPGDKIAVFDFGGGTLDIAVLESQENGSFDVVAAHGINTIGGKTLDAQVRRWVDQQLEDSNPELLDYLRTQAPLTERFALEDSIRRAKELLSEASYANISIIAGSEHERLQITREEFESIIGPTVERAIAATRETLFDAGITSPDEVVALYMTGGSSRIPLVQERLKELGPVATLDDPKTVVAQGALSAVTPVLNNLQAGTASAGVAAGRTSVGTTARTGDTAAGVSASTANTASTQPQQAQSAQEGWGTPSAWAQSESPSAQAPGFSGSKSGGKKTPLIVGAIAGVVVIGGIAAAVLIPGGNDEASQAANASSTSVSADTTNAAEFPAGANAAGDADTIEEIIDRIPKDMNQAMTECGFVAEDGYPLAECKVKKDGDLNKYFVQEEYTDATIRFGMSDRLTRSRRAEIVQTDSSVYPGAEVMKSPDEKRVARVMPNRLDESYSVDYTDSDANVYIFSRDFQSKDLALQFLNDHQLL